MEAPKWITIYVCPKCSRCQTDSGTCVSLCEVQTVAYWYRVHGPVAGGTQA